MVGIKVHAPHTRQNLPQQPWSTSKRGSMMSPKILEGTRCITAGNAPIPSIARRFDDYGCWHGRAGAFQRGRAGTGNRRRSSHGGPTNCEYYLCSPDPTMSALLFHSAQSVTSRNRRSFLPKQRSFVVFNDPDPSAQMAALQDRLVSAEEPHAIGRVNPGHRSNSI